MVLWGSTYLVTKEYIEAIPPSILATLRYAVVALILVPLARARGGLAALPRPVPWATLVLMGVAGVTVYYVAFNYAIYFASASQGALIQALSPAAIAAVARLQLRERLSTRRSIGIALSVIGVALVVSGPEPASGSRNAPLGALFMFVTVLAWATYTALAKRLAAVDEVVVAACVAVIGGALFLPGLALEWWFQGWPHISAGGWLGIVYLGAICSALCYVIYSYALRQLAASEVGVYANLVPIVGVALAVVFLGETLHPWQAVGGTVALIGMWLSS